MNKIIISFSDDFKHDFISNNTDDISVVVHKRDKDKIKFKYKNIIYFERLNNIAEYLNFLSASQNTQVVLYDVMRYVNFNNTGYNRIYDITKKNKNVLVLDNFPFVFDHRNIFVPLKFINESNYHQKQFYDDNFFDINGKQANDICVIANDNKKHFIIDKNYDLCSANIVWEMNEDEKNTYEAQKHKYIYEKNYAKVKIMTCLLGATNRCGSKMLALKNAIDIKGESLILTNWEKANENIKTSLLDLTNSIVISTYHEEFKQSDGNIYFFENIISQKISFYDAVKFYNKNRLYFFTNNNIGIDKMNNEKTSDVILNICKFVEECRGN